MLGVGGKSLESASEAGCFFSNALPVSTQSSIPPCASLGCARSFDGNSSPADSTMKVSSSAAYATHRHFLRFGKSPSSVVKPVLSLSALLCHSEIGFGNVGLDRVAISLFAGLGFGENHGRHSDGRSDFAEVCEVSA